MKKGKKIFVNIMMVIVCILTLVINAIAPWGREALDGYYGTYAVKTDKEKMNQLPQIVDEIKENVKYKKYM